MLFKRVDHGETLYHHGMRLSRHSFPHNPYISSYGKHLDPPLCPRPVDLRPLIALVVHSFITRDSSFPIDFRIFSSPLRQNRT